MSAQHMKTPWKRHLDCFIKDNRGNVCTIDGDVLDHMIKCVNAHEAQQRIIDELVKACKNLRNSLCDECGLLFNCSLSRTCDSVKQAEQALAKLLED